MRACDATTLAKVPRTSMGLCHMTEQQLVQGVLGRPIFITKTIFTIYLSALTLETQFYSATHACTRTLALALGASRSGPHPQGSGAGRRPETGMGDRVSHRVMGQKAGVSRLRSH
jgi:hypothetical protein